MSYISSLILRKTLEGRFFIHTQNTEIQWLKPKVIAQYMGSNPSQSGPCTGVLTSAHSWEGARTERKHAHRFPQGLTHRNLSNTVSHCFYDHDLLAVFSISSSKWLHLLFVFHLGNLQRLGEETEHPSGRCPPWLWTCSKRKQKTARTCAKLGQCQA